jgi:hypothetical protein
MHSSCPAHGESTHAPMSRQSRNLAIKSRLLPCRPRLRLVFDSLQSEAVPSFTSLYALQLASSEAARFTTLAAIACRTLMRQDNKDGLSGKRHGQQLAHLFISLLSSLAGLGILTAELISPYLGLTDWGCRIDLSMLIFTHWECTMNRDSRAYVKR